MNVLEGINFVLRELNGAEVQSENETPSSRSVAAFIRQANAELMAATRWFFASEFTRLNPILKDGTPADLQGEQALTVLNDRETLLPNGTGQYTPPYEYRYYYDLPSGILRIDRFEPNIQDYILLGNRIWCNYELATIFYTRHFEFEETAPYPLYQAAVVYDAILRSVRSVYFQSETAFGMNDLADRAKMKRMDAIRWNRSQSPQQGFQHFRYLEARRGNRYSV